MRSKIVIALAALTFAVVGCEKRDTSGTKGPSEHGGNTGHSDPSLETPMKSPGLGGGPSEDMMGGKDGGATSNDPQTGSESLSGGGAKTSEGASGESMAGDAGNK